MNEEIVKLFLVVGIYPLLILITMVFIVPILVGFIDRPKRRSSISHRIRK